MGAESAPLLLAPGVVSRWRRLSTAELTREQTDGQGAVGNEAEAVLLAQRQQVWFQLPAVEKLVLVLNAGEV